VRKDDLAKPPRLLAGETAASAAGPDEDDALTAGDGPRGAPPLNARCGLKNGLRSVIAVSIRAGLVVPYARFHHHLADICGCSEQKYVYSPGLVKVKENFSSVSMTPI